MYTQHGSHMVVFVSWRQKQIHLCWYYVAKIVR
jgi:hypothetical protein